MADVIIRRKPSASNKAVVEDSFETLLFEDGYLEDAGGEEDAQYFSGGYLEPPSSVQAVQDIQTLSSSSEEPVSEMPCSFPALAEEGEFEDDDGVLDDDLFTTCNFSSSNEGEVQKAFDSFVLDEGFDDELTSVTDDDFSAGFDLYEKTSDDVDLTYEFEATDLGLIDFEFEADIQATERVTVEYDGVKDSEDVASEFAVRLVTEFDLDIADYDTLFSLFMESSYEQTAKAISNGFHLGLTVEEVSLAAQLKGWWRRRADFMTKIERITKRGDYSSRIARKVLSWNQAFKVIQAFEGCPTLDELEIFVEDLFEYWNSYRTLQREFKSFQGFLLYMCSSIKKTHWMIPNYTISLFQQEVLCLCRSWYSIEDFETHNQIKAHVGSWGRI